MSDAGISDPIISGPIRSGPTLPGPTLPGPVISGPGLAPPDEAGSADHAAARAVLARFESLGDNCEFGFLQRMYGLEESTVFRWARSFAVGDVTRLLGARFEGLFELPNLQPCDETMVADRRYGIHFHTRAGSVFDDGNWRCTVPEAERLAILADEASKMGHLVARTVGHLEAASRIFVYKTDAAPGEAAMAALLAVLRRYGDNRLLVVTADGQRGGPRLERLGAHLFHGVLHHFAPYATVADGLDPAAWLALCRDLLAALDAAPDAMVPSRRILFAGSRYTVRFNHVSRDNRVVVVFDPADLVPVPGRAFWGEDFFERRGINAIGVTAHHNDWYTQPEISDAISAIRDATPGMERVGYGGSMGGFAVINHVEALGFARIVSLTPQFSPDPAVTPFEARFDALRRDQTEFPIDRVAGQSVRAAGYVIFDSLVREECEHIAMIARHHDLCRVVVPFSGHHPFQMLGEAGLLEEALLAMLDGALDMVALRRRVRAHRRQSSTYLAQVGSWLRHRNHNEPALRLFALAQAGARTPRFDIASPHAETLFHVGRAVEARAMMVPWFDDAVHEASARRLHAAWADPVPVAVAARVFGMVAGTRVRTGAGDVAVEALVEGELVATELGLLPVRWLGKRRFDGMDAGVFPDIAPVCLRRGSLGKDLPVRDLWLGRDHLVRVADAWVAAGSLAAAGPEAGTLFHVELDLDVTLVAEGVQVRAACTCADWGSFANARPGLCPGPARGSGSWTHQLK